MKKELVNESVLNREYGVRLNGGHTEFTVWSPSSKSVEVCVYKTAKSIRRKRFKMSKDINNIWYLKVEEDLEGQFYTYLLDESLEVIDPYVHSTNGNSTKGAILDAEEIYPKDFLNHRLPKSIDKSQSILYEVHVKDFSMCDRMPFEHKGKYLSFTERGLEYNGHKIGIDHLVELGITTVHLLPVFDFITVNDFDDTAYNWGYDPYLFNAPEGSYSSDPDDPYTRIRELKAAIQSLHEAGLFVVLDVVYNHTYFGGTSNFHRLMPYVFHRFDHHKTWQNGSGCGNELDTEHPFVAKFIMDSLKFWLQVYQVDGFRFDLMGLYDTEFIKNMTDELLVIKPDIILYGEPWTGGPSGLELDKQMLKGKQRLSKMSMFNDDFRNAIKGSNDESDLGFVGDGSYRKSDIYAGCFGSIKFNDDIIGFTARAEESINYVSSHDNLILMDKISKSDQHRPFEDKQNMNAQALSIVLLSLGIPFLQAGTEFLRSKYGDHNSYKSGFYINRMHWSYKEDHRHVFDYIKKIIEFRKSQRVFTLTDQEQIKKAVKMFDDIKGVIRYCLESPFEEDYESIQILHNGTGKAFDIEVLDYNILIDGALYYKDQCKLVDDILHLPRYSSVVLIKSS